MRIEGRERRAAAVRLGLGTVVAVRGGSIVRYSREDVAAVNAEMKRIREERKFGRESRAMERAKRWAAQYVAEGQDEHIAMQRAIAAALGDSDATAGNPRFCKEFRRSMLDELAQSRSDCTVMPAPPPGGHDDDRESGESGRVSSEAVENDEGRAARPERTASMREDGQGVLL